MSAEENRAVVRAVLDALDNADWAALECHPGLYETRQNYHLSKAAVPDSRHTIEQQVIEGEMIASVCTVSGTHAGPFFGIPATGKPVSYTVLLVDRVRDGVIVQHWALPDLMSVFQQIGQPPFPVPSQPHKASAV